MNRSEEERTRIIRTWLDEGGSELSPRVHDAVLREFPTRRQDGASAWRMPITAYATVAVATAAVVVLVLASLRLLPGTMSGGSGPTATPSPTVAPTPTPGPIDRSYRDVGHIGLPPSGAIPSDPGRTELLEMYLHPGGPPYKGAIFLYADGRLVWNEYYGAGALSRSTGWLEQRLTSDGIELVRALATRGPDMPGGGSPMRLDPVLLPDQLPASAWADATIRPYVPSGYAACLILENWEDPFQESTVSLSEKLAMLPTAAADLLRDREEVLSDSYDASSDCVGMTTAEARLLDEALSNAGLEQDDGRNGSLLEYHVVLDRAAPDAWRLGVWFEPILPDGTITCSSCG
jgi:hypothetical protein